MKKLTDYQAIIVDMDGTLYYQQPVRMAMLVEMLLHFWRLPDFLIVWKYRRMYEQGLNEEERLKHLPMQASKVIREWMIIRPLKYVRKYRDRRLIGLLQAVEAVGTMVIVYSDYPVSDKLTALMYEPDKAIYAQDTGCMKPATSGLVRVLAKLNIEPERCLVIGDRSEKDGTMAENMGADYIILHKRNRSSQYTTMII